MQTQEKTPEKTNYQTLLTVEDLQIIFRISRASAYKLINSRGFPAFRINRKIFVHPQQLDQWIFRHNGKSHRY